MDFFHHADKLILFDIRREREREREREKKNKKTNE